MAIIAVLVSLLLPALAGAREKAWSMSCLANLRQIGLAVRYYAEDHEDEFPRSQHSAFVHGQRTWGRAIAPGLGVTGPAWTNLLKTVYHCPSDRRREVWSYGLNVYFELGPEDDYVGKPATWRRTDNVPRPASTILQGENASGADHIMPNFWVGPQDAADLASERHRRQSNYSFVDGHAETRRMPAVYAPERDVDAWNPLKAR